MKLGLMEVYVNKAPTGRSQCHECGKNILIDSLRLSVADYQNFTKHLCEKCALFVLKKLLNELGVKI